MAMIPVIAPSSASSSHFFFWHVAAVPGLLRARPHLTVNLTLSIKLYGIPPGPSFASSGPDADDVDAGQIHPMPTEQPRPVRFCSCRTFRLGSVPLDRKLAEVPAGVGHVAIEWVMLKIRNRV
jgi:hypothetical protein